MFKSRVLKLLSCEACESLGWAPWRSFLFLFQRLLQESMSLNGMKNEPTTEHAMLPEVKDEALEDIPFRYALKDLLFLLLNPKLLFGQEIF
jgi:hypothetical protein